MNVYLPNLNHIRFFASALVIFHHIEQFKEIFHQPNLYHHPIQIVGKLGVVMFFVLSGFLITFLLLTEEKISNTINIKAFYIRRVLRIWPLYYLIIILAFFVFPYISFFDLPGHGQSYWWLKLCFFAFLMPNIIHALGAGVAYANQCWSIGAEEQFYLVWPLLIKFIKDRLKLVIYLVLGYMLLKLILSFFLSITWALYLYKILGLFCIDCMAIGSFFSFVWINNKSNLIKFFFNKYIQIFIWLITFYSMIKGVDFGVFQYEIYALFFGIIIFNLALNKNSIFQFKNKVTNYLGKISYGLYMFHPIAIVLVLKTFLFFNVHNQFLVYAMVYLITVVLSYISYNLLEKKFITIKSNYSLLKNEEESK